ncbi:MAG: amidohydrolase family protein [Bryobacteraceae bacterium]
MREQHVLTLMDALNRMTAQPAGRLGTAAKGRIEVGADADVTVFDAARAIDRATFQDPAQYSEGIRFVLVAGTPVVRDGAPVEGAAPGKGVRRKSGSEQ